MTALREQHDTIWQPILAAHRVASHLRAIAADLPLLSAQAADPLYDVLDPTMHDYVAGLLATADDIERAAPLPVTITDEDKEAVFQSVYDQLADDMRETARDFCSAYTDADWAEAAASLALE